MKLLIAYGDENKLFHLKEFAAALSKLGVECKLVSRYDYVVGFPTKKIKKWIQSNKKFKKLLDEFAPDVVFVDGQDQFGLEAIKAEIPLFVLLRGNIWLEYKWANETIYKDLKMRTVSKLRHKIAERVLRNCQVVFSSNFLHDTIKEDYPNTQVSHFLEGLDVSRWYPSKGMNLKHPCIGLVQHAFWWGKTKEMLVLKKAIQSLPDVHFYWVGFGQYQDRILQELSSFDNFHWLGKFSWEEYPENVRQFLTEIDVYALPTGMDTLPLSCKEAMAMQNPVIATNVGGIHEMVHDGKTGFLIDEGNSDQWIDKISFLLKNKNIAQEMGKSGKEFVTKEFSWDVIAKRFVDIIEPYLIENTTKKLEKNS